MNQYMKVADDLAKSNLITNNGGPFGACIVKNGEIVGKGANNVLKSKDPTAHAEINAIRDASKNLGTYNLEGCELYTSCYPCPMCMSAIIQANIKVVYYGNTKLDAASIGFRDDFIYEYFDKLSKTEENDTLKLINIDRDSTIKTFADFDKMDDNIIY